VERADPDLSYGILTCIVISLAFLGGVGRVLGFVLRGRWRTWWEFAPKLWLRGFFLWGKLLLSDGKGCDEALIVDDWALGRVFGSLVCEGIRRCWGW
jgi:hypothetical protein